MVSLHPIEVLQLLVVLMLIVCDSFDPPKLRLLRPIIIDPIQWQNNQAPNRYKFHFYIRARIMMIRCQHHMELSDLTLQIQIVFKGFGVSHQALLHNITT